MSTRLATLIVLLGGAALAGFILGRLI